MRRFLSKNPTWWCRDCRREVRERICPGCGHDQTERRVRCRECGLVARRTLTTCPDCGTDLRIERIPSAFLKAGALPATVVVTGRLIEDRTPASPPPAPGAVFAPVPRQLPWFDLLGLLLILSSLVSLLLPWFGWFSLLVPLALLLIPVLLLGLIRRFRPATWQRLRERLASAVGRLLPEIRRIIVQTADGRLVGIELAHPSRWPPTRSWPVDEPLRVRCEGAWVEPDRLLRAERITVVDERGGPLNRPIRARSWQTFPTAVGLITLVLLLVVLIRAGGW